MMEEEDETSYLNEDLIKELDVSKEQIEKEKAIQIKEIKRRKTLYRNSKSDYDIDNKIVILVDDGAATGATLIAAARWTRMIKSKKTSDCNSYIYKRYYRNSKERMWYSCYRNYCFFCDCLQKRSSILSRI